MPTELETLLEGLEAVALHALEQAKRFERLAAGERDETRSAILKEWQRGWTELADDMARAIGCLSVLSGSAQDYPP